MGIDARGDCGLLRGRRWPGGSAAKFQAGGEGLQPTARSESDGGLDAMPRPPRWIVQFRPRPSRIRECPSIFTDTLLPAMIRWLYPVNRASWATRPSLPLKNRHPHIGSRRASLRERMRLRPVPFNTPGRGNPGFRARCPRSRLPQVVYCWKSLSASFWTDLLPRTSTIYPQIHAASTIRVDAAQSRALAQPEPGPRCTAPSVPRFPNGLIAAASSGSGRLRPGRVCTRRSLCRRPGKLHAPWRASCFPAMTRPRTASNLHSKMTHLARKAARNRILPAASSG